MFIPLHKTESKGYVSLNYLQFLNPGWTVFSYVMEVQGANRDILSIMSLRYCKLFSERGILRKMYILYYLATAISYLYLKIKTT